MNVLNESLVNTEPFLPELDLFGAGIIVIVGIIALIVVIRYFLKRKK